MLLVTGASGLLGASLVSLARNLGLNVIALCHRHKVTITGVSVYNVDLTDRMATREVIANLKPASIVHCAAATNVDWCEDHPKETREVNVQATSFVAEIASELKSRLVYISTDSVFDGKRGNYSEAARPAPLNVYARSKLRGEHEVFRRYPAALVARVSIYGWNVQNKQSLAEWIIGQLAAGKEVRGFTDVHFSPMLVNDLAEVLLSMLDRQLRGLYHVVGSERISKYEFARRVAKAFGFEPERVVPTRLVDASLRAARPLDVSLNTKGPCCARTGNAGCCLGASQISGTATKRVSAATQELSDLSTCLAFLNNCSRRACAQSGRYRRGRKLQKHSFPAR